MPDANLRSTTHHVQVSTVDPEADATADGSLLVCYGIMEQTNVTDANLQKELLPEYKYNSKNISQEYTKFLADKKSLIKILFIIP